MNIYSRNADPILNLAANTPRTFFGLRFFFLNFPSFWKTFAMKTELVVYFSFVTLGPNMAWWNKWWNRMEEEALSTKLMEKQRTIPTFMSISTKYEGVGQRRKIFTPGKISENKRKLDAECAGVVSERHPQSMPEPISNNLLYYL